jgi:hypothetical protein
MQARHVRVARVMQLPARALVAGALVVVAVRRYVPWCIGTRWALLCRTHAYGCWEGRSGVLGEAGAGEPSLASVEVGRGLPAAATVLGWCRPFGPGP